MLPDYQGCLNLLEGTYRLWSRDASKDPGEAAALAEWLEVTPAELAARLVGQHKPARRIMTGQSCLVCGGPVVGHHGRGRAPIYCGETCRNRARHWREKSRRR